MAWGTSAADEVTGPAPPAGIYQSPSAVRWGPWPGDEGGLNKEWSGVGGGGSGARTEVTLPRKMAATKAVNRIAFRRTVRAFMIFAPLRESLVDTMPLS